MFQSIARFAKLRMIARPLALSRVPAGFPSPAEDYVDRDLDLNEFIEHPSATFFFRLEGDSMFPLMRDGDLLVVDRAIVAIESAGFTLVKGDLSGIVRARELSEATMRNIRQILFFAMVYNAAGVPVAAGLLYPFFGILISPMFAAAAMSLSSISVIANALRLRRASY